MLQRLNGWPPSSASSPCRPGCASISPRTRDSEERICNLTDRVGVSQPTVSHQMKLHLGAGLLERHQHGQWAHHRVVLRGALDPFATLLARIAQPA